LARALECRREGRALAALRDALLPKLIPGELRLKDAAADRGADTLSEPFDQPRWILSISGLVTLQSAEV
jgi:hypothetical protein